jgi:general secretion pathway protein C
MRKPVYLGVIGSSIAVCAVALGFSLTRYLSLLAWSPKSPPKAAAASQGPQAAAIPPEQWRNLFAPSQGMKLPSRLASVQSGVAPSAPRTNYTLLGTIVSPNPTSRRAILWADGMREPRLVKEKDEVEPGAFLSSVERDKAWITRGKDREKLELLPVGSRARSSPSPPGAAQTAAAPSASVSGPPAGDIRVTKLADNRFSIDEGGVTQLSTNFNQFMTQIRLVPYFEGNKSAGYRIAAIRPGTTFDRLGFQGGDVLQQVNGLELASPEKMYTIFQNLKDEKKVTVNILRQGQKNTLTYEIR